MPLSRRCPRELARTLRSKLTDEDRKFLSVAERLIDQHIELFRLLAE
jgi:hypothetical protein